MVLRKNAALIAHELMSGDSEELKRFKEAAEVFGDKHTVSREAAMKCLVEMGIYHEDGELTEEYGGTRPMKKKYREKSRWK